MVLTETDFLPQYCAAAATHTAYLYNKLPSELVGNYENRVSARPVKDWGLATSKTIFRHLWNSNRRRSIDSRFGWPPSRLGKGLRMVSHGSSRI